MSDEEKVRIKQEKEAEAKRQQEEKKRLQEEAKRVAEQDFIQTQRYKYLFNKLYEFLYNNSTDVQELSNGRNVFRNLHTENLQGLSDWMRKNYKSEDQSFFSKWAQNFDYYEWYDEIERKRFEEDERRDGPVKVHRTPFCCWIHYQIHVTETRAFFRKRLMAATQMEVRACLRECKDAMYRQDITLGKNSGVIELSSQISRLQKTMEEYKDCEKRGRKLLKELRRIAPSTSSAW